MTEVTVIQEGKTLITVEGEDQQVIVAPTSERIDIEVISEQTVYQSGGALNTFTVEAGMNLSSGRAVHIADGKAFYVDVTEEEAAGEIIGLTKTAALIGDTVVVQVDGIFEQSGLGLNPGTRYYIGPNGTLIITANSRVVQPIGVAITQNKLSINLQSPIITI